MKLVQVALVFGNLWDLKNLDKFVVTLNFNLVWYVNFGNLCGIWYVNLLAFDNLGRFDVYCCFNFVDVVSC